MIHAHLNTLMIFLLSILGFTNSAQAVTAATSAALTYQGRILKTDGTPLEYSNVSFIFQILDPSGSCIIYQEQISGYNMTNSSGMFDVTIGSGTMTWPGGTATVIDSFNNSSSFTCGSCSGYTCSAGSSTYSPLAADGRVLHVSFYDGTGWKVISPDSAIRAVPFAGYAQSAQKLGTNVASDFVLKSDVNNSGSGSATCDSGSFLTWNATSHTFGCAAVSGAAGGTVTSVTAASPLSVTNGTSTPNITIQAATSSQNGYLTSADWTTFNNKLGASSTLAGDVSGTAAATSVDKIKGTALSIASLTSSQYLKYNGTNWVNSAIAQSDVTGLSTTLSGLVTQSQFPASCAASQTLTFISPSGSFSCSSIAIAGSQVSGNISGNAAGFTGSLTGDVSGTQGATSVDKIKGVAVSATAPTSNQVLQYNGTNWVPATISTTASGTAGGDLSGTYPNPSVSTVGGSAAADVHTAELLANAATTSNTASAIVKRDASGNFTAGTITANLTGAASANVLKTGDSMSGNLTHAANMGDIYTAGSGANTATIEGPSGAIGTSYVLRLPTSQSSGTQALVNDGSGNLSWQSLSSGSITSVSATSPLSSTGGTTPTVSLAGLTGLGTANQILGMNNGATGYEYKTVTGTSNQITVTHGTNSITLATPQNIHSGASPTFAGLTLSGMSSAGFVKNNASGVLSGGNAVSLASDISGTLPVANGGTGATSFANYSVIAANSSGNLTAVAGSTSGSILNWTVTGPAWTTASFPTSTTANQLLYSSANNVVGGLATVNSAVLTTNSSGVPSFSAISGDLFSQYALLAGRSGGQTLYGGTAASDKLILDSTSSSTKGSLLLNPTSGYVGIGTLAPSGTLDIENGSNTATLCLNGTCTSSLSSGGSSQWSSVTGGIYYGGNIVVGAGEAGTPSAFTIRGPAASGTNVAGADMTIAASNGTGSAGSGSIVFQTAPIGASGAASYVSTSQGSNSNTNSLSWSHTVSSGSNLLLLVHVTIAGTGASVSGITFNGSAMTQLTTLNANGASVGATYYMINPPVTTANIVVSMSNWGGVLGQAINIAGANQSSPFETVSTGGNTWGTSASLTPTSSLNELVMDFLISNDSAPTITASQTSIFNTQIPGQTAYATASYKTGAAGSTTMSYGLGSGYNYGYMAVAIKSASSSTAANTLAEAMRIATSGYVGIGTSSPTQLLHVNGSALATAWNTSSDARLKTNVSEIQNPLDKLLQLRGVEFDWKTDIKQPTNHEQIHDIGVIAQDVEKVFPEAVTNNKDGYKAVAYSKLVSPIIAAVKALYARLVSAETHLSSVDANIESLKAENDSLKAKNAELESRLNKIEKALSEKQGLPACPSGKLCQNKY